MSRRALKAEVPATEGRPLHPVEEAVTVSSFGAEERGASQAGHNEEELREQQFRLRNLQTCISELLCSSYNVKLSEKSMFLCWVSHGIIKASGKFTQNAVSL